MISPGKRHGARAADLSAIPLNFLPQRKEEKMIYHARNPQQADISPLCSCSTVTTCSTSTLSSHIGRSAINTLPNVPLLVVKKDVARNKCDGDPRKLRRPNDAAQDTATDTGVRDGRNAPILHSGSTSATRRPRAKSDTSLSSHGAIKRAKGSSDKSKSSTCQSQQRQRRSKSASCSSVSSGSSRQPSPTRPTSISNTLATDMTLTRSDNKRARHSQASTPTKAPTDETFSSGRKLESRKPCSQSNHRRSPRRADDTVSSQPRLPEVCDSRSSSHRRKSRRTEDGKSPKSSLTTNKRRVQPFDDKTCVMNPTSMNRKTKSSNDGITLQSSKRKSVGKPNVSPTSKSLNKTVKRKTMKSQSGKAGRVANGVPKCPTSPRPSISEESSGDKTPIRRNGRKRVPRPNKPKSDDGVEDDISVMTMDIHEFDKVSPTRAARKKTRVPRVRSEDSSSTLPFEYEFDSEPELILVRRRYKSPHASKTNSWISESSDFSMTTLPPKTSIPTVNYVTCDRSVISFDIALALAEESSKSAPRSTEQPVSPKHAPSSRASRRPFLRRQDSHSSVTSAQSSMSLKSIQSCFTTFLTPRKESIKKPPQGVVEDSSSQTEKTASSDTEALCDPDTIKRRCSLGHGSPSPAQSKSKFGINAARALSPKVRSRERTGTDSQSRITSARASSPKVVRSRGRKETDSQSLLSASGSTRSSLRAKLSFPKLHFPGHNFTTTDRV